jgi:type I pantothenate kinase
MDHLASSMSPYRRFSRAEWASLRADTPLTLTGEDIERLQGFNDPVSLEEVVEIYLPLSRLLSLYVAATQGLYRATERFLGATDGKMPYIIGVAGSVAAGKSTTARILQALLARWPNTPKVDLITTDGFLYPNHVLEGRGLLSRKGFPESYDRTALLRFLSRIKAGEGLLEAPVYSHITYDVVQGEHITIDRPDILIVEGLNVLQTGALPKDGRAVPYVSDFFDMSIYLDADEDDLYAWYMERFMKLRATSFRDPKSYFAKYVNISDEEALAVANKLWATINLVNLRENVLPTRLRADLILRKGHSHAIEDVMLRKL